MIIRQSRFFNYEAIPGPHSTPPPLKISEPIVTQEVRATPVETVRANRPPRTVPAPGDPTIWIRYDPLVNRIIVTAEKDLAYGEYLMVVIGGDERGSLQYRMDPPSVLALDGGQNMTNITILHVLKSGAHIPVLQTKL